MRITGLSNLYGFTNTSALQQYHAIRNAARAGQTTMVNRNNGYGRMNVNGSYRNYASQVSAKIGSLYEGTKASAQDLRSSGQRLMNPDKDGVLAQAAEKGSTKAAVTEVTKFVDDYNTMVRNMSQTGGAMNNLYARQLQTDYNSQKEALEQVGITAAKDGTLRINQAVLDKADVTALQKAFGSTESFAGKVAVKSIYIEANAVSEQITSQYARYGSYLGTGGYGRGYSSNLIGTLFQSLF